MKKNDQNPVSHNESVSKTPKFRHFMALLNKAKINESERHDLIYAWTQGRTASSREITSGELQDLVWKFENHFDAPAVKLYLDSELKRLRSVVLSIATRVGLKEPNDFVHFNRFMLEYSILKKELHKYTLEELHPLITQFRGIETHFKQSSGNPGTKAWFKNMGIPQPEEN